MRWAATVLEALGILHVFAIADRLDQSSRLCHDCVRCIIRISVEIRWLLESFNVSVHFGRPVLCLVQPQPIRPFWTVLEKLPASMTNEIESLLSMALTLYDTLGKHGYYDGEISLDNVGFQIHGSKTRVVLMDYGSVVATQDIPPEILKSWLQIIRGHYEKSYQVYKLRAFASGDAKTKQIVETSIQGSLELIDKWLR